LNATSPDGRGLVDREGVADRPPEPSRKLPEASRLLDRFELAALACLTALAAAVLGGLLLRVWLRGGLVTGADGYVPIDQFQHLAWLREAGEHITAGNRFDLAPGRPAFLHPGDLLSGLLHRLGVGPAAAHLLWKPVGVMAIFVGSLLYVRRFLSRREDRRLALVLALFAASPVAALVGWATLGGTARKHQFDFLTGELWAGNYLWGYPFTAIAVGLLPLGLLAYERGRAGGARGMLLWAAAAGLLCSWLQPWQGATLALVLLGAEGLCRGRGRARASAARDLWLPLAATVAPLVYYLVLSRTDDSWELVTRVGELARWPLWVMALGLAPLAVPALLAYRLPARDFGAVALRLWPLAALAIFYQPAGTFPFHALQGLTLPLVVLGVAAARDLLGQRPLPLLAAACTALLMVAPGTAYRVDQIRKAVNSGHHPFFLTADERDALGYLDRLPEPGGVLAPAYSGQVVPGYTGRETWVGARAWTPDFRSRQRLAERLFGGRMSSREAEQLIRGSGARFLFSDCHGRSDIQRLVAGAAEPPVRFGCASVHRIRGDVGEVE
jgi:hypothetical protein